jgi:hypothetical protein
LPSPRWPAARVRQSGTSVLAVTLLAVLALPLAAALLPAAPVVVATQHPAQLVSELPAPRSDRLARSTSGTPAAASAPTTIEYLVAHGARE